MKQKLTLKSLGSISELKYVNVDNGVRYRAIMRYLYLQYERLNYWLSPEQIYEGVTTWDLLNHYTLEQCQLDLDQLTTWKNVTSRHHGGKSVTIEEYLKKKFQYLITPYSIELERFLENLENIKGYGGSLEPTLFDTITDLITEIYERRGEYTPKRAFEVWNSLYESFQKLNQTSIDYIASLQTGIAEDIMMTTSFLLYKDSISIYLQDFVQTLQRKSYRIEGNLKLINDEIITHFLTYVQEGEWLIPKLEQFYTKEEYCEGLEIKWSQLYKWFCGMDNEQSEMILLERASKDAILRIVRSTLRIQEKRRSVISRRKDLDYLGQWFYRLDNIDDAHKLSAYAFGIFPTRHIQGSDNRDSDSQEISMWNEITVERIIRSRSRKRSSKNGEETEIIIDHTRQKADIRSQLLVQQKQETKFLIQMVEKRKISICDFDKISSFARVQLLGWIERCISSKELSFCTVEGIRVGIQYPDKTTYAALNCEDGELTLLDYEFSFQIENEEIWMNLLERMN